MTFLKQEVDLKRYKAEEMQRFNDILHLLVLRTEDINKQDHVRCAMLLVKYDVMIIQIERIHSISIGVSAKF